LLHTIHRSNGKIVCDVPIDRILINENMHGLKCVVGIKLKQTSEKDTDLIVCNSVISGAGYLRTHLNYLSEADLTFETKAMLSTLSEMRPKLRMIFWLTGSRDELHLSTSTYLENYEFFLKSVDNYLNENVMSPCLCKIWSPSAKDSALASW